MPTTTGAAEALAVRPPQQRRSRERWAQTLDAGVALLEEGGYEAFTIAAVCERASVPPRAIYARTASKDALFLAVYEHGMARIRDDQVVLADAGRRTGLTPAERVRAAVAEMVGICLRHQRFLRAVVLVSGIHPEVRRRGSRYGRILGEEFAAVLAPARDAIRHADPESAVRTVFGTVFASAVLRVAYGPDFATPVPLDDDAFVAELGETAVRYLLADAVG